ncbi:stage V sporulation protein AB [Paenibacillus thermotolerans]|uniref:stage V sporulation protein AB n=1 Tax=Paenibacillus thermotolerans TaxID=3027807 RepID=UPI00236751DB|nr:MULTISPECIES: stage V sporulation protein AB [unclassified Paenibacillus]
MTAMLVSFALIFLGLSSGLAVGSGLVAFLVVLDVIPRLAQITGSAKRGPKLEAAVVLGALYWTCADFFGWRIHLPFVTLAAAGLLIGAFVGCVAAALTEVLNVFPILARRLGMDGYISRLLAAMVLGKVLGSLFEWLSFRIH